MPEGRRIKAGKVRMLAENYFLSRAECNFIESLEYRTKMNLHYCEEEKKNECKPKKVTGALKTSGHVFQSDIFSVVHL